MIRIINFVIVIYCKKSSTNYLLSFFIYLLYYIKYNPKELNKYPVIIIPTVTIATKIASSFGLITLASIIIDGKDKAVTLIINASTVPIGTPAINKASAIGIVPNISAYIGIPITDAIITEKGLLEPNIAKIISCGIQL